MQRYKTIVMGILASTFMQVANADVLDGATQTVDQTFSVSSINWQRGSGSIDFAIKIMGNQEDHLILCGAVLLDGAKRGVAKQVPDAMQLFVDGKRVVRSFGWMPIISKSQGLTGSEAKCQIYTDAMLRPDSQLEMKLSKTRFGS